MAGRAALSDLARPGTHNVVGNRSFGDDPELVTTLGRVVVDAMLEVGSMPIFKHIPGYGRVNVDPHFDCPVVDATVADMSETDFVPFVALRDAPWAMVAHLIFSQIDPEHPASVSPAVCNLIRSAMGFDGVLISGCLTMEALKGTWPERVKACLDAGYDIALHSQGDLAASEAAAKAARPLTTQSLDRIARAEKRLGSARFDVQALHAEVEGIFRENGFA